MPQNQVQQSSFSRAKHVAAKCVWPIITVPPEEEVKMTSGTHYKPVLQPIMPYHHKRILSMQACRKLENSCDKHSSSFFSRVGSHP